VRAVNIKVKFSISLEYIFSSCLLSKPKLASKCTKQVGFLSFKNKNLQNTIIKLQIVGRCSEQDWAVRIVTVHHYFTSVMLPKATRWVFFPKK